MNHAIVLEVLYLCYWHSQESSLPVQDSLRTTSGTWPTCMSVYTCILPSVCVSCYLLLFSACPLGQSDNTFDL